MGWIAGFDPDMATQSLHEMPADAFYEWKVIEGGKRPYAIARQDGQPLAFAGPMRR